MKNAPNSNHLFLTVLSWIWSVKISRQPCVASMNICNTNTIQYKYIQYSSHLLCDANYRRTRESWQNKLDEKFMLYPFHAKFHGACARVHRQQEWNLSDCLTVGECASHIRSVSFYVCRVAACVRVQCHLAKRITVRDKFRFLCTRSQNNSLSLPKDWPRVHRHGRRRYANMPMEVFNAADTGERIDLLTQENNTSPPSHNTGSKRSKWYFSSSSPSLKWIFRCLVNSKAWDM